MKSWRLNLLVCLMIAFLTTSLSFKLATLPFRLVVLVLDTVAAFFEGIANGIGNKEL